MAVEEFPRYVFVYVYVSVCEESTCHCAQGEARGQLAEVDSLLLPYGSGRSDSGQVPLPAEPSSAWFWKRPYVSLLGHERE